MAMERDWEKPGFKFWNKATSMFCLDFPHFSLQLQLLWYGEDGRDALNLEEFCRWFPTVLGLEPLSPQHIEESLGTRGTIRHPKSIGFPWVSSVSSQLRWWYWCNLVHFTAIPSNLTEDQRWHQGKPTTSCRAGTQLATDHFTRQGTPPQINREHQYENMGKW